MGIFTFRQNPTGRAMDDAEFMSAALQQPMGFLETTGDQAVGSVVGSFGTLAVNEAMLPQEAPTSPGLVFEPPKSMGGEPDPEPLGRLESGSIDLNARPRARNEDGSISTVHSMSFGEDGREVVVPTIADDGRQLSDDEAIEAYRTTGRHLGKFDTPENATAYGKALSAAQAEQYGPRVVPDTREMRSMLSGASRGRFAEPIPFRQETPEELEDRRRAAGALSEEDFKASAHYREGVPWDAGMTEDRARAIAGTFDRRKVREFFAEKRPIASIVGQFGGGLGDPLNFIPFAGPAVKAAAVAKFGRVAGTGAVGAIDAMAGSALSTAASIPLRQGFGEETTWQGAVSELAISAMVGTAFGSVAGFVGGRLDARRERLQAAATKKLSTLAKTQEARVVADEAITAVAAGEPINLSPTSQAFLQDAIDKTADAARALDEAGDAVRVATAARSALDPHRVAAADGMSIDVVPRIVEARDLITSADEGFSATLQPRQRGRAASQTQVQQIASTLDPERLGMSAEADRGAPIIGPDRMVESGNGRVMAIREAYRMGGEQAANYRAFLERQGADLSGFSEPVMIRERSTPLDNAGRQAFTVAANRPATLAMSATERARADAAVLTPDTLSLIRNADDLGAAANSDFVRQFVRGLPQSEAGALTTAEGRISTEGLGRVRNAVLAAAYDDTDTLARITETTDDEVKSISNAMTAAAPSWAALLRDIEDGRVPKALDTTPALLEAVKRTADIRSRGMKLADYLKQIDAFDTMPETVEGFMRLMYDPAGKRAAGAERISRALKQYATEARKVSTDEGLGLGLDPVETRDLMALIRSDADGQGRAGNLDFGDAPQPRDGTDAAGGGPGQGRPGDGGGGPRDGSQGGLGVEGQGFRPVQAGEARGFLEAAPERSLDELYQHLPEHHKALEAAGADIARAVDVEFKSGGLKDKAGAAEKMNRKGYASTQQLTDLVRGGFVARRPADAGRIVEELAKRFDVLDEGWSTSPSGYVDRKALVRFDDGTVGEVQIWQGDVLAAKKAGGHKLYLEARSLDRGDPRRAELEQQQRDLYAAAASKAGDDWSTEFGAGGKSPNIALKASSSMREPLSPTSALSTSIQAPPGSRMANALDPSVTAGRRSQLTNRQEDMPGILGPEGVRRLVMGTGAPLVDQEILQAAKKAATRIGKPDDYHALAEQFGIDPKTGDFPEMAEIDQLRAEGRLSAEDEAVLAEADRAIDIGRAYGDALRASVGCLL